MSYLQEKLDIEAYFQANWNDTPITFENGESLDDDTWVRLSVVNGPARQVSMGDNPDFRYYGMVYVQIYTKKDVGSAGALALVDKVDNLFKNLVLTNLRFKVPQVRRQPISQQTSQRPEWLQINVSTEFYRG